jgi:hypothetical protein
MRLRVRPCWGLKAPEHPESPGRTVVRTVAVPGHYCSEVVDLGQLRTAEIYWGKVTHLKLLVAQSFVQRLSSRRRTPVPSREKTKEERNESREFHSFIS